MLQIYLLPMPKVYFRASSGKAVTQQINWEINYDQALQTVSKAFKIAKENVKLIYNGEARSANFNLNNEIPHHIVHIKDNSKIAKEELNINLTIESGQYRQELKNVQVKSNTQVKDFLKTLVESRAVPLSKKALQAPEVFHDGVKLNDDDTFVAKGVEDNGTVSIQLRGWDDEGFPDPSDVNLCANLLRDSVDGVFMDTAMEPKFAAIAQELVQLKNAGMILAFQQQYEKQRTEVVFSPFPPYILKPRTL